MAKNPLFDCIPLPQGLPFFRTFFLDPRITDVNFQTKEFIISGLTLSFFHRHFLLTAAFP